MKQVTLMSAIDAALQAAGAFVADTESLALADVLRRRSPLGERTAVITARVAPGEPADVGALRWLNPGGACPLVFTPADFGQAIDLGALAGSCAKQWRTTTYVLLDHETAELEDGWRGYAEPKIPASLPADDVAAPEERSLRRALQHEKAAPQLSTFEPDAVGAKAEWLVISYGSTVTPARQAVTAARAQSQRVNHLALQTLWPVPEAAVIKAATGAKHVVVPERNLGQYVHEIRRVLPMLTVIPVGSAGTPVESARILDALRTTPRCC